jgi:hypothetical protein
MVRKKEITDFGKKIGGARKDLYEKGLTIDDINELNHRELLKVCIKKNVWKKPNYEEMVKDGVPKEVAYFYKLAYDGFPTKINTKGNFESDIEKAKNYIELGQIVSSIEVKSYSDLLKIQEGLIKNGYLESKGIGRSFQHTQKSYGFDLSKIFNKIQDSQREYERRKAISKIEETNFPYKQEAYQKGIIIRERNIHSKGESEKEYVVCKKQSGYYITLDSFDSREKAEQYINTTLKQQYEERKNKQKDTIEPRPQLRHIRRRGIDFRKGKDIDTEIFQDTFKFRGGEFGNWNTQDDRQQNLNLAYDSLIDLSRVLKISPQAVALDGTLALAFGSRGRGGIHSASAHYEPSSVVINLTKMRGAGSLAHEWGHALDDYLGKRSGNIGIDKMLTDSLKLRGSAIPKEVEIVSNIMNKIKYRTLTSEEIIQRNKDNLLKEKEKFRDRTIWNLAKLGGVKDKEEFFKKYDYFLNPQNNSETYEKNFDKFFKELPSDVKPLINKLGIKSAIISFKEKEVNVENVEGQLGYVKEDTKYFKNAKDLDKYRSKPYFTNNVELFARAFETYVESKLKGNGLESNYLVYGTDTGNPMYPPKGEREEIFKEFDKLFEEISVLDKSNVINDDFSISDIQYENTEYKEMDSKENSISNKVTEAQNIVEEETSTEKSDRIKMVDFEGNIIECEVETIKREIAIGLGDSHYGVNLLIDNSDGKALGIEIDNVYSDEEYIRLMDGNSNEFKDTFYIESLWEEFVEVPTDGGTINVELDDRKISEDFHIWEKGTKVIDIKEWFEDNYNKDSYRLEEMNPYPQLVTNTELDSNEREGGYRYYLTQRPPSIGTHPRGTTEVVAFDERTKIDGIEAWGYVEYSQPLSESQIDDYELTDKSSLTNINQDYIQEGNSNINLDDYEKYIEQILEEERVDKANLVEELGQADSFRFEFGNGDYKKVALVIPNMGDSDEKFKVVFGVDKGDGVEVLSHTRLNTDELADRLVSEGFSCYCLEEKLKVSDLQISDREGKEINVKGLMDYKELQKKGDITVIRVKDNELENIKKLTIDHSLIKGKDYNKLLVLRENRIKALEELGKRDKQLGGIPYSQMKTNKGRQYIEINNLEYERIRDSNIVHSAFRKDVDKITLVVANVEAKEKALIQMGRNHEKTLGNVKYEELKGSNTEIAYKQLEIKSAMKTIEKMLENGVQVNARPNGDKIYLAFKKEDMQKVQAIMKSINNKDRER